jgi:hypothetical protein
MLAGDKLVNSSDPVSVISLALGYGIRSRFQHRF